MKYDERRKGMTSTTCHHVLELVVCIYILYNVLFIHIYTCVCVCMCTLCCVVYRHCSNREKP